MKKRQNHNSPPGAGRIAVNKSRVVYNSTMFDIPDYYEDKPFKCKQCSKEEIWTAKQQQWWYEEAKGDLETTAVLCRSCRNLKKEQRYRQKGHDADKT